MENVKDFWYVWWLWRSDHLSLSVYQCWKRTRLFPGASSSNMDSWSPDYAGQVAAVTLPPTPLLAIFLFITKAKDTHTQRFSFDRKQVSYRINRSVQSFSRFSSAWPMEFHGIGTSWYILASWYMLVQVAEVGGNPPSSKIAVTRRY